MVMDASGNAVVSTASTILWKSTTGVFALLWLFTLILYIRHRSSAIPPTGTNGSISPAENDLLKQIQDACRKGDASLARKDLSHWIRSYAPHELRGSMRDFGNACGDATLQAAIADLDAYGFADEQAVTWKGDVLWTAFKSWQTQQNDPQRSAIGDSPDLYAG